MKEYNLKSVGMRLKLIRKQKKITQKYLGEILGIAQNTISQYEKGLANMSVEILYRISLALDESADYILGIEDA